MNDIDGVPQPAGDPDDDFEVEVTAALFGVAARWFLRTLAEVGPNQWDGPGLGEWNVRELVAHTARTSFDTVTEYLVDGDAARGIDIEIDDVLEYYQVGLADPAVHAQVAERAREALRSFGDDLIAAVTAKADTAFAAVDRASDDAVCVTRFGAMWLPDFLDSRIVELVLHTLDIRAACTLALDAPAGPARRTLDILAALVPPADRGGALLALAGRRPLPTGFNALG